jgi:hypothetical protein
MSTTETPLLPRILKGSMMGKMEHLDMIADASFSFGSESVNGMDDTESETLRAKLEAAEQAILEMRKERDKAIAEEEEARKALEGKHWESVEREIRIELERNRDYMRTLQALRSMVERT